MSGGVLVVSEMGQARRCSSVTTPKCLHKASSLRAPVSATAHVWGHGIVLLKQGKRDSCMSRPIVFAVADL